MGKRTDNGPAWVVPAHPLVEQVRECLVLVPEKHDGPAAFLLPPATPGRNPKVFCDCTKKGYASCAHAERLCAAFDTATRKKAEPTSGDGDCAALFDRLMMPLVRAENGAIDKCTVTADSDRVVIALRDTPTVVAGGDTDTRQRLRSRFGHPANGHCNRHELMRRAVRFTLSEHERALEDAGLSSTARARDESVWSRLLYHCRREYGCDQVRITADIDTDDHGFWVCVTRDGHEAPELRWRVAGPLVATVLGIMRSDTRCDVPFELQAQAAEVFYRVRCHESRDEVTVEPIVYPGGEMRGDAVPLDPGRLFGSLLYDPDGKRLVPLSSSSMGLASWRWDRVRTISFEAFGRELDKQCTMFSLPRESSGQLSLFDEQGGDELDRLQGLPLVREFDTVALQPHTIDRHRCSLSAFYRQGHIEASLAHILRSRADGGRFLVVRGAVVDCRALRGITLMRSSEGSGPGNGDITMSRAALLRLRTVGAGHVEVIGDSEAARKVRALFQQAPDTEAKAPVSLQATLRHYQALGLHWLLFLWDNGFGGLLCDEMGLGKTHQALALMTVVREQRGCTDPFLVVCPTTVIPHWERIVTTYAPSLRVGVYHGSDRDVEVLHNTDVVITSYGVLRIDSERMADVRFGLAVFDEAHQLKNPDTQVSGAARAVDADMKLGLTGTPVQNHAGDLKSLFDLVLHGYLGDDDAFVDDFVKPLEDGDERAQDALRRITAPFVLRRTKATVLAELPPKIVDVRTCSLSDEQTRLYEETVEQRGRPLLGGGSAGGQVVSYMHIFAVLNRLKQICDHPALVLDDAENFGEHHSGKWDLFVELLDESLGSEQKVVVYTQYLGMVDIIGRHLSGLGVGHVKLTGGSTNRGRIVKRFNTDDSCRVFVGTLGAGGVGIDLTAGSVVIHYDRWWNAAREDQATDRVHRIGQSRGVQVFKLVTEGTLEERIDMLIAERRELAQSLPEEDSPDTLKSFSRDELLALLGIQGNR